MVRLWEGVMVGDGSPATDTEGFLPMTQPARAPHRDPTDAARSGTSENGKRPALTCEVSLCVHLT